MNNNLSLDVRAHDRMKNEIKNDGKILEIGPLNKPFFHKSDFNVYYADINSTEDVKSIYSSYNSNEEFINSIVDIDYVIKESYEDTFKDSGEKFDYVFSSHVLEHVPDPIQYLIDISKILSDNGKLCLLLPNKEFTFDHFRENSSFADLFDMYLRGDEINTPRLVLDSMIDSVNVNNPIIFWNKELDQYPNPNVKACLDNYSNYVNDFNNHIFDGHLWVFTDIWDS